MKTLFRPVAVAAGLFIVAVAIFIDGASLRRANAFPIVTDSGEVLSTLFQDVSPSLERWNQVQKEERRKHQGGLCAGAPPSGSWERLMSAFGIQSVHAQDPCKGDCGSHYLTYTVYPCGSTCWPEAETYRRYDTFIDNFCSGWQYSGTVCGTCEQCRELGCNSCQ